MKIKSDLLRAAMLVQAVNDIRLCLNGVRIDRHHVKATNGHVAVMMEHGARVRVPITVNISAKIPAKAIITKFEFCKGGGVDGIVRNFDALGMIVSVATFKIQEGKYPDFELPMLFGDMDKYSTENISPKLGNNYLALPSKMFPKDKFGALRVLSSGESSSALIELSPMINHTYGNPKLVIMPTRW